MQHRPSINFIHLWANVTASGDGHFSFPIKRTNITICILDLSCDLPECLAFSFSLPFQHTFCKHLFPFCFYSRELNRERIWEMTSEDHESCLYVWTAGSNSPVVGLRGLLAELPRAEGLLSCDHPMRPRVPRRHRQQALTCWTVCGWMKLSKHLEGTPPPLFSTNNGRPRAERLGGWSISHPICTLLIIFLHFQTETLQMTTWDHMVLLFFFILSPIWPV